MRTSTLFAGAALAASAFASPMFKRDLEIDTVYDTAYETVYVTETEGVTVPVTVPAAAPAAYSTPVEQAAPAVTPKAAIPAQGGYTSAWTSYWTVTPSAEPTVVASSSAAPAATTQASSTIAAPAGKATTYQERVVDHHNVHRANHSAPALEWDSALAATAAKIAATCVYAHSMDVDGGNYGQNIAAGVEANNVSAVITELFYNGEVGYYTNLYGQANPDMTNFEKWGHFSQLVWKGTTKVGCATQYCSGGLANVGQYVSPHFTVCNYGAPGNYAGEYADNIGASLNQATQSWSYNL
ncbi:PR-1-like protein [Aureobasidium namibiae CBS 147.97]|uniref:PR-1-like protein n=1 Tax=Aureobasidium namibiae CBS 147.97 TaxID=1043004 RepID=A0A074WU99_9PEZI|nr:PR-1-like protein [Aureobasidium namibiae CBS 147.97]KEQ76733.1 PR-1-like protein [Aureobasidium namibiae CBS 147.97]